MQAIVSQFHFTWYAVPLAVVSSVIFLIGVFVLLQNTRSLVNFSFFLICLCINFWMYGLCFVYSANEGLRALAIYRTVTFLGVSFIATAVYFFSVVWLKLRKQLPVAAFGFISSLLFYVNGLFSDLSFPGVYKYFWGYYPKYGPVNAVFFVFFFGYFFAAFANYVISYLKRDEPVRRKQIKLISIAFLISFMGSIDYLPKFFYCPIMPVGFLFVGTWIMMVAYSIIKYKVMDIQTVIHKTLMWATMSFAIALPFAFLFYFSHEAIRLWHPAVTAIYSTVVFFVFLAYARAVQPWVDHLFERRKYDLERELIRFNENLVHLKGLTELIHYISQVIRDVLYIDKVEIFMRDVRSRSLNRIDTVYESTRKIALDEPFIKWLQGSDKLSQEDFLHLDPDFEQIKDEAARFFQEFRLKVIVPLVLNGELIGLINLGQKSNLKAYALPDIKFLSDLRRAVTIAFSNSLRLIEMQESLRRWNEELEEKVRLRTQELEEAQKQLIQAEKLATIGTLAGGVAHEINNPLAAVLTNAQLLQMTIKDPEDLESIQLIEEGAKRCQIIVQKLMKYARKPMQKEVEEEVDLNQVIENVAHFLSYQFQQENIEISSEMNPLPKIRGVGNELEQVITNLLLNAKDAIKDAGSKGKIEVRTYEQNGHVCASVKDNGQGIKPEHLSKIFDPFFTTKDVGKGTGLGLSICFSIVEKHQGKFDVQSTIGKGTVFIMHLPKK